MLVKVFPFPEKKPSFFTEHSFPLSNFVAELCLNSLKTRTPILPIFEADINSSAFTTKVIVSQFAIEMFQSSTTPRRVVLPSFVAKINSGALLLTEIFSICNGDISRFAYS